MSTSHSQMALITGASAGIGRAMAHALSVRNDRTLVLVARRREKLEELKQEILELYPKNIVHLIDADINDPTIGERIAEVTHKRVDILINNAGLALGRAHVKDALLEDWDQMIATNVTANFKMAHLVVPWMLQHGVGDIINVCSISGFSTYAGGSIYCATKHAVHAFTKILREETCGNNIRVMQISPGMVETEFSAVRFKGDSEVAKSVYQGLLPLVGEDVARSMMFMLDQPRHVVLDEIIITPINQGAPTTIVRGKT